MMKFLLVSIVILFAIVAQAVSSSAYEQYQELKLQKAKEDAAAERKFALDKRLVEADRDLAIYKEFLKLRAEKGLEARIMHFTGNVVQRISVMLGKKQLVVRVAGTDETIDVTAVFRNKIPDTIKIGDAVKLSGMFQKGNFTGVTLMETSVITKD